MSSGQWMFGGILILVMGMAMMLLLIKKGQPKGRKGLRAYSGDVGGFWLLIYRHIAANFLTKHAVGTIRSRIEIVGNANERAIRKKTVQIFLTIVTIVLGLFLAIVVVTRQLLLILLFLMVLWFLAETLVDFFVIRLKNRLLKQQIRFNDLIRHKYYETGTVDEAIYHACQSLDRHHHEIGLQGQRIHDILMAKDVEKEMESYYDTAPNKFLKILLGLAYITMEYGDTQVDGSSVFMKNMGDLTGEIRIELTKREQLNYALKSLNVIVLLPLFFISPIRSWAGSYFMPLKAFYESQTGFFMEVLTIVMIFVCYLLLRRVQQVEDNRQKYGKNPVELRLYEKVLHPVVDLIKPKKGHYYKAKRQLKSIASTLSVEAFTTRRLLFFVSGLLLACVFFMALHYNQRHQILTAPTLPDNFLGGQLSAEEMARAEAITHEDNGYLFQMSAATTEEEILRLLKDKDLSVEEMTLVASRLMNKQAVFFNQYLKWWEVVVIGLFAIFAYQVPVIYLHFQQRVARIDIEDEVAGFSTVILMLMHHERMSVTDILEWMELFATSFREPIGDCLNNTAAGLTEALEGLREATDNERFTGIVDSLILASEDITIGQAFDELASEKEFYIEERKETNRRIVERKINMGRMVGFIPMYGLILLYMIIPMVVSAMTNMNQYFEQLQF